MCLVSMTASAQWRVESVVSGEPNTKLLQILETEKSVLIYANFEKDCSEKESIQLNRNTHVKSNGLKYKILHSVNLPIGDEADDRFDYLSKGKNEVNFVMEFEKFPVESGFDIIENTKEGDYNFNFRGVTVSRIDSTQLIDTERFLDTASPVIKGRYAKDGTDYAYLIREGVCITCNAVIQSGDWFSADDMIFYLDIVNNSNHGIMFDFDRVGILGQKFKSKGAVEEKGWVKYTPDSYDAHLAQLDYDEARYKTSGGLDLLGNQINREKNNSGANSWARLGWAALGALTEHAIDNRVEEYMKAHPKDRPRALRTTSLKPGESLHGYIACKKKKADKAVITLPIDDFDFAFRYGLR